MMFLGMASPQAPGRHGAGCLSKTQATRLARRRERAEVAQPGGFCLTVLRHNSGGEPSQMAGNRFRQGGPADPSAARPLSPSGRSHVFDSRIIIHPALLGPAVTPAALPSPTIL